jgi:hypothetical protein
MCSGSGTPGNKTTASGKIGRYFTPITFSLASLIDDYQFTGEYPGHHKFLTVEKRVLSQTSREKSAGGWLGTTGWNLEYDNLLPLWSSATVTAVRETALWVMRKLVRRCAARCAEGNAGPSGVDRFRDYDQKSAV